MSASNLSDLLPIPDGVAKPHAYQVFGLDGGERDNQKVSDAMRKTYAHLKAAKSSSDPATWKKAARMAEEARKLLSDPEQRRELDARFGVIDEESDSADVLQEDDDPLAAVLPGVDPLSGTLSGDGSSKALLGTPPLAGIGGETPALETANATNGLGTPPLMGAPPLGTPPTATTTADPTNVGAAVQTPQTTWSPQKPTRRRKKKSGMALFAGFLLVMFAAIGGLLFYLVQGGQLQIGDTPSNNGQQVAQQDGPAQPNPGTVAAKPSDGILTSVAQSGVAPSLRGDGQAPRGSGLAGPSMSDIETPPLPNPMESETMEPVTETDPMPSENMTAVDPDPKMPEPTSEPEPTPTPDPTPSKDEMAKANQAKIDAVVKLIQVGDWEKMKTAAEALRELELTEEQVSMAETLFDIADLATFYRGAVSRGLATLAAGATFEFGGLDVVVVEATSDGLTIRYDRKSKTYTIDQLPPRLMEKIASFSLPVDRADSIAGLALYRLIQDDTNTEYRVDAFEKLANVEGLDGVDAVKLLNVAQDLLDE